jgi:hypothetical protein
MVMPKFIPSIKTTMTETFKASSTAFASGHYDYVQAIKMYDKEIEDNATNSAAYNNRGLCKIHIGADPYDSNMIKQGMDDFNMAIKLAEQEGVSTESAQHNLAMAITMLKF